MWACGGVRLRLVEAENSTEIRFGKVCGADFCGKKEVFPQFSRLWGPCCRPEVGLNPKSEVGRTCVT